LVVENGGGGRQDRGLRGSKSKRKIESPRGTRLSAKKSRPKKKDRLKRKN